ncbi:hypothetical protein [Leuconostoc gasicomitatum]|uniref:hypothetical protein n=1 Tax=Leuconostoc gasicomitatum TaxID=115778 RepID=UPI0015CBC068|nr:hypothetical protein [Leuconostoc gasicomitatum]QLG77585.1 hypothetical protein LeuG3613_01410 [Leuconostoc gasicomitatum]
MFNVEFNFWSDLLWPLLTEFVWIPIIVITYQYFVVYRKKRINKKLGSFHNGVVEILKNGSTNFDQKATNNANSKPLRYFIFSLLVDKEKINIENPTEEEKKWNHNHELNKLRQFFLYIDKHKDFEKYVEGD